MMSRRYISADTAPLFESQTGDDVLLELLWGDHLHVLEEGPRRIRVRARGKEGFVEADKVGDQSLLEFYFIDVGQGDGIYIRTPDDRHLMIDGGFKRASQPTGKNAADFVDWKFTRDYGREDIHLDVMMASHNDSDHYGGLSDLLDAAQDDELGAKKVTVDQFYHAGLAWWTNGNERWLGPTSSDGNFLVQLMEDREQVMASLADGAAPRLQGEWAKFMRNVLKAETRDGRPTPIHRLSDRDNYVPGFESAADGAVAIRVLAPVERIVDGKPALPNLSTNSKNTNGNSLLLRVDFGRVRILLTGDLNAESQHLLLEDYAGQRIEFLCDVAKACHHGSDDVSYAFLGAMNAAVTIISSGDNEGHDHPRPGIIAASATTGHLEVDRDRIVSPLVYSTELARSLDLGKPKQITVPGQGAPIVLTGEELESVEVVTAVTKAGDLQPTRKTRSLAQTHLVTNLIYGLVNVRTDGDKILCATLNEKDRTWQVKKLKSRF